MILVHSGCFGVTFAPIIHPLHLKIHLKIHSWHQVDTQGDNIRQEIRNAYHEIEVRWDQDYISALVRIQADRRNQKSRQQRLAVALSALSPLSSLSFVSMDLARTGLVQQERIEDAINACLIYLTQYVQAKNRMNTGPSIWRGSDLKDFSPFTYQDADTIGECLYRNVYHVLSLAVLAVLGFAGAYVAILRYDVR